MARYIDAEKLCKDLMDMARYQPIDKQSTIVGIVQTIKHFPTADVVPRVEVEYIREAYNNKLAKDIQTNADFVRYATVEVAREIFEEIDRMCIDTFGNFNHRVFADLKKKYTESE